ncbi:MAG: metallophosphoesterase [Candidatus Pacearchaeota archaeon]
MENKKKILAISDFHGDISLAEKAAQKAKEEEVEFIAIPGDLGHLDEMSEEVLEALSKSGRRTFLIPGNHDTNTNLDALIQKFPGVYNIHGKGFFEDDIGIFGTGYAALGPFANTEKEMLKNLNDSHEGIKNAKKKILLTHEHPLESDSELGMAEGSEATRKAIEYFKPDIAIHGHIHEAGGIEEKIRKTRVFNVARKYRIFEI